jgi:hypothetical protein
MDQRDQEPFDKQLRHLQPRQRHFKNKMECHQQGNLLMASSKLAVQVEQYYFSHVTIDPLEGRGGLPDVTQTENSAYAAGTWIIPDDDKDFPLNVAKIRCDKTERVCHEIFAWVEQPTKSGFGCCYFRAGPFAGDDRETASMHLYLTVDDLDYNITSWSRDELVAARQSGCSITSLTIRLQTKDITYKDIPTPSCSESILSEQNAKSAGNCEND